MNVNIKVVNVQEIIKSVTLSESQEGEHLMLRGWVSGKHDQLSTLLPCGDDNDSNIINLESKLNGDERHTMETLIR